MLENSMFQVITSEEAECRGHVYDAEGMTYLFDLDFNDGDNPFTVDARNFGNVSHFVNHSVSLHCCYYERITIGLEIQDQRGTAISAKRTLASFAS
jgi:SET domain-containing protein